MQLILVKFGKEEISVIDIPHDSDGVLLAQMVQVELSVPINEQHLEHEGIHIQDQPLAALGIVDGSTITVKQVAQAKISIYDIPSEIKPEELLSLSQQHPHLLQQFQSADPELAGCLATNDINKVRMFIMKRHMAKHKVVYTRKQEDAAYAADPDNPELQAKIAERIRLENIEENMQAAMENLPESFGRVIMLYVNIEVNGLPVKAFVDSGAQSTIMSLACAERCGITRLMDKRFSGTAKGVGEARILGRVHIAQMKFGNSHFPISITILESDGVDFLFGLDTLKRYRCCIDLAKNCLRIDGSSGPEEVQFLPESELPENARGHVVESSSSSGSSGGSGGGGGGGGGGGDNVKSGGI